MDLEQRVLLLEQEVEILKNQLQATLLEVREQLLAGQYPALRADQVPAPPTQPALSAMPQAAYEDPTRSPAVKRFKLNEVDQPAAQTPPPMEVTWEQEPSVPGYEALEVFQEEASLSFEPDLASLTRLSEWASNNVARLGLERTQRLIEIYARTEYLSTDLTNALLELVALYAEEEGPYRETALEETVGRISQGLSTLEVNTREDSDATIVGKRALILKLIGGLERIGEAQRG